MPSPNTYWVLICPQCHCQDVMMASRVNLSLSCSFDQLIDSISNLFSCFILEITLLVLVDLCPKLSSWNRHLRTFFLLLFEKQKKMLESQKVLKIIIEVTLYIHQTMHLILHPYLLVLIIQQTSLNKIFPICLPLVYILLTQEGLEVLPKYSHSSDYLFFSPIIDIVSRLQCINQQKKLVNIMIQRKHKKKN